MISKLTKPLDENEIKKHWIYKDKIYISCCCITYNQKEYIKDTIDGFLAQVTEYQFEIIIYDDVSTDGTRDILFEYKNKYPSIIQLVFPDENQYSLGKRVTEFAINQSKGEYIAFCEGDDYWIDNKKIDKQCRILEKQPEMGLVFTNVNVFEKNNNKIRKSFLDKQKVIENTDIFLFIINKGFMAPCTWFMRKKYSIYPVIHTCDGSFSWFIYILLNTNVYFLDECTTVYRLLDESASHSLNLEDVLNRERALFESQTYYADQLEFNYKQRRLLNSRYIKQMLRLLINYDYYDELQKLDKIKPRKYIYSLLILCSKYKTFRLLFNLIWKRKL